MSHLGRYMLALSLWAAVTGGAAHGEDDPSFDSNGVKIHYVVEGHGEPVVLIHGYTANIQVQWRTPGIIAKLSPDYQVIALDHRGHGSSDKPHDPEQYGPEMAEDVIRLMDHLKIARAHLVGYSMGGFITNYLLATHPDRIISATLGGAGWMKAGDARMSVLSETADSLDAGKGIGPLIRFLTPAGRPKPTDEQLLAVDQSMLQSHDMKALAACMHGMSKFSVTEEKLRTNKTPVLALIGELDPLKFGVDELATSEPNVTVSVIKGADHTSAFSRPEFIEALRAFLANHAESKSPAASGK